MQIHYPAGKEGLSTHQSSSLSLYFHVSITYSTVFFTDFGIFLDINPQAIWGTKASPPAYFLSCSYNW